MLYVEWPIPKALVQQCLSVGLGGLRIAVSSLPSVASVSSSCAGLSRIEARHGALADVSPPWRSADAPAMPGEDVAMP